MIVFIVHGHGVLRFKSKSNAPVSTDIDSPSSGSISFQFVQPEAGKIHVLWLPRRMESAKYQTEPFRMRVRDSCEASRFEEAFQPLMPEASNHWPYRNPSRYGRQSDDQRSWPNRAPCRLIARGNRNWQKINRLSNRPRSRRPEDSQSAGTSPPLASP